MEKILTLQEKQKEEALKRMKKLKLHPNVIKEFNSEGKLNKSVNGMLFWLEPEEQAVVDKFQEEYGTLVYHVIKSETTFGLLLNLLYVSKEEEEWEMDNEDLNEGYAVAYIENLTDPMCSEIGSIGIIPRFGGLVRIS